MQETSIYQKKILTLDQISEVSSLKSSKILVGGCFDILHYGHTTFLGNARQEGDVLIVLLESDEFIKKYKHRHPIHTQDQRAQVLANLTVVDYVIKLPLMKNNEDYFNLVKKIKPAIIAVTKSDPLITVKKEQAEEVGAEVKVVVDLLPFSSSKYASFFRD
jgi:cytidyltransferase-like protein